MVLNEKQKIALKMAIDGHNLAVLGSPCTGKTFLLNRIFEELKRKGKNVQITCSTGISCSNFSGQAQTVHRWAGLQDGRYTASELQNLIKTSPEFELALRRIEATDVLIIDEISMLSKNIFEQLASVCSVKNSSQLFGGMQLIVSGDFFQLPPVQNNLYNDNGEFCFKSKVFQTVLKHKIILEEVVRQQDIDFIRVIREVSTGDVNEQTNEYMKRLERPITGVSIKLFSNNYLVDLYNRKQLLKEHGNVMTYQSKDEVIDARYRGNLSRLNVQSTLWLKESAPVILLRNLSNTLVNGLQRKVVSFDGKTPVVHFPAINVTTKIEPVNFTGKKIKCL